MIAMKASKTLKPARKAQTPEQISRSVKVADEIHYQCRIYAAQERVGIQEFIEKLLVRGLRKYGNAG